MRTIKTTTGIEIPLDGELLTLIETLFQEITVKRELDHTYEDVAREINNLVDQMTEDERRAYFVDSLFLTFNRYENDRLSEYLNRLTKKTGARK
jgi:hypothetical protein